MALHCIMKDDEELFISRRQYSSLSSMLADKFRAVEGGTVAHVGHGAAARVVPGFRWEPQAGALANARPRGTPAGLDAKYHRLRRKSTRSSRGVSKNHVFPLVSASRRPLADRVAGSKAHSGVVLYPSVFSQGPESRAGGTSAAGSRSIMLLQSSRAPGSSKSISHVSGILSPQAALPGAKFLHTLLLNADRQRFETKEMATSTTHSGGDGGNCQPVSEKTFKKLVMGRSRLSQVNGQKRRQASRESLDRNEEEKEKVPGYIIRPLSSLDLARSSPVWRSFADQSFRARSRGQSLAHGTHGLAVGSLGRQKSSKSLHVAQYQMSINAMAYFCADDDDNILQLDGQSRGPSAVAWHQAEEQEYKNPKHPVVQARVRAHDEDQPKPCAAQGAHERWTFNSSSSWNLSFVQKPTSRKQPSAGSGCMAMNWHRRRQSATVPPRLRNLRLLAKDFLASVSGRSDRNIEKLRTKPDVTGGPSGRSRWPALGSWKRRIESSTSARPSEIDRSFQADSDELKIEATSIIVDGLEEAEDEAQVDKTDLRFDSRPVASSFVSGTTDRHRIDSADRRDYCTEAQQGASDDMIPGNTASDDLVEVQCSYHNYVADARSMPDSDLDSLKWSLIREDSAASGPSDQSDAQWVQSGNCRYYVKEMLDRSLAFSSSRAFGGNSVYGRTGRFRIDLEGGPRLEYKPNRPTSGPPDLPRRITKAGRRASFYNRVMLSPCMPFFERRKQPKNGRRRTPASFAAGAPTCMRSNTEI